MCRNEKEREMQIKEVLFGASHNRVGPPPAAARSARRVARTARLNRVCVQYLAPRRQALPEGVPLGVSDRKVIFGPRGVGSDVTSVSSSSGPGSSLDPEILPSFSCCSGRGGGSGAAPTDAARGGGRVVGGGGSGGGSSLSHPSPLTQWCFSR